jgi:excisionase family DNA binding protein
MYAQDLRNIFREIIAEEIKKDPYYSLSKEGERLLTLKEAAAYCNVCTRTLTTRVKNGDLKNGGTGRKYLFKIKDLDEFMFNDRNSSK